MLKNYSTTLFHTYNELMKKTKTMAIHKCDRWTDGPSDWYEYTGGCADKKCIKIETKKWKCYCFLYFYTLQRINFAEHWSSIFQGTSSIIFLSYIHGYGLVQYGRLCKIDEQWLLKERKRCPTTTLETMSFFFIASRGFTLPSLWYPLFFKHHYCMNFWVQTKRLLTWAI